MSSKLTRKATYIISDARLQIFPNCNSCKLRDFYARISLLYISNVYVKRQDLSSDRYIKVTLNIKLGEN